jgi:DNA-binding response OmpR family regulator
VFNSELSSAYEVDVIVCAMRKKFMNAFGKKIIKTKRSMGYYI